MNDIAHLYKYLTDRQLRRIRKKTLAKVRYHLMEGYESLASLDKEKLKHIDIEIQRRKDNEDSPTMGWLSIFK